ncbi:MAG: hypothetical protein HYS59_00040, partial [Candidatus Vogelbacteria bacterium]|nr:hypothetical protein [Candidatus Vogelbacteria bacterium]
MAEPICGFKSETRLGFWPLAGLVILGALASNWAASVLEGKGPAVLGLLVVGTLVAGTLAAYVLRNPDFDTAVKLMVVTLPMTAALVIDIGGSIRITYLFTLLAVAIGLRTGAFRLSSGTLATSCLHAYVIYALISTTYTFIIPELRTLTVVGFRGSVFRSFIQFGQLALMVTVFHVILSYARSRARVERVCTLIFWSMFLASVFALYEVLAFTFNLPFINIHTTPLDTEEGPLSLEKRLIEDHFLGGARSIAGVDVVRPRSFLSEPIEFAIYLLFSVPFSVIAAHVSLNRGARRLKMLCVFVAVILFLFANARAGFIAVAGVLPVLLIWAPNAKTRRRVVGGIVGFSIFIGFAVFPLLGAVGGISGLVEFVRSNYEFILSMEGRGGSLKAGVNEPLQVFLVNPLLGVGIGNYPFYLSSVSYGTSIATTGSIYASVLTELGILGFIFFLGFIASIILGLLHILRRGRDPWLRGLAYGTLISIVGVMISRAATSGLYTDSYLWVMLALGAALPTLASQREGSAPTP